MAFIPVADTVKVAMVYAASGQTAVNTLYFHKTSGGIDDAYLTALGISLTAWWTSHLKPLVSSVMQLNRIEMKDLTTSESPAKVVSVLDNGSGDATIMPLNVTKKLNFSTGLAGRAGRGSNYFPCLTEGDCSGNNISSTMSSDMIDAYTELYDGTLVLPADTEWSVISYVKDGVPRDPPVVRPVVGVYIRGLDLDSMKSRLEP